MGNEINILALKGKRVIRTNTQCECVSSGGRDVFMSERKLSRDHGGDTSIGVLRELINSQVDVTFLKGDSIQGSERGYSSVATISEG